MHATVCHKKLLLAFVYTETFAFPASYRDSAHPRVYGTQLVLLESHSATVAK